MRMHREIIASGFYLTEEDIYILAGNITKRGVTAMKEKERVHKEYSESLVSFMSRKYDFGHGIYMIFDEKNPNPPVRAKDTSVGEYILITKIRYTNDVVKPDEVAEEKRKTRCMNVLRRYGIEDDLSQRWYTFPSSMLPFLEENLRSRASRR